MRGGWECGATVRKVMRRLLIYGVPAVGAIAALAALHFLVRPLTPEFLGHVAVLVLISFALGFALDRWSRRG